MRTDFFLAVAAAALLALSVLLGGASAPRAGAVANGFLQLVALVLLLSALWTARRYAFPQGTRSLVWIFLLFLGAGLLTLVPLPASIWTSMPGREPVAHGFALLRMAPPPLPLTLTFHNSIASLLWLLPPAAMFMLVMLISPQRRRWLLRALLVMAGLSIVLGAAQLLGGNGSRLRPYTITNDTLAVGFFANANHLATLLVCALPVTGYLAGRSVARSRERSRRFSAVMVAGAIALLLLVGIAIIGSMAGYGLALPATLATLLIYRRAAYGPIGLRWVGGFSLVVLLFGVLAFAGPLNREALSQEFSAEPSSRGRLAANTVHLIADTFPAGTGLGSFSDVYRTIEQPDPDSREFANHAHNDYVEIVLEMGLVGALVVLAFIAWWGWRAWLAWTSDNQGSSVARAGSVIVVVVLLHSLVDYPLRTSAIAVLFAMACAMMLPSATRREPSRAASGGGQGPDAARHIEAD
ncbi:MAG TPA: O-antigen ligase family protein [Allosphingosinicella sp.]